MFWNIGSLADARWDITRCVSINGSPAQPAKLSNACGSSRGRLIYTHRVISQRACREPGCLYLTYTVKADWIWNECHHHCYEPEQTRKYPEPGKKSHFEQFAYDNYNYCPLLTTWFIRDLCSKTTKFTVSQLSVPLFYLSISLILLWWFPWNSLLFLCDWFSIILVPSLTNTVLCEWTNPKLKHDALIERFQTHRL